MLWEQILFDFTALSAHKPFLFFELTKSIFSGTSGANILEQNP